MILARAAGATGRIWAVPRGLHGVRPAGFPTGGDFPCPLDNDTETGDETSQFLWHLLPPLIDGTSGGTTATTDAGGYDHAGGDDGTYVQGYGWSKVTAAGAVVEDDSTITVNIGATGTLISISDAGSGSDAVGVGAAVALADAGAGTDALAIAVGAVLADSGTGVEAFGGTAVAVPVLDAGAGADTLQLAAALALADAGAGADAVTAQDVTGEPSLVALTDTGTGAETVLVSVVVQLADAGSGVDVASLPPPPGAVRVAAMRFSLSRRSAAFSMTRRKAVFSM